MYPRHPRTLSQRSSEGRDNADYRAHHPRFLPPAFSDFRVEQGGVGAGTVHSFKLTAGSRTRAYRMRVEEPEPGRVLTESNQLSSAVTTFTVTPEGPGCRVRVETRWQGTAAGWAASSSGCSRRACCAGSTRTSLSEAPDRAIGSRVPLSDSALGGLTPGIPWRCQPRSSMAVRPPWK